VACVSCVVRPTTLQVLDGFFELEQSDAMADIYVWLRYSATRQLTWQRNYNTQPRILSAAQVGLCVGGGAGRGEVYQRPCGWQQP
jgi:hypothetical protein